MRLIADAAGVTGLPHVHASLPAQDFYLAKTTQEGAYVVISDGCSHGQIDEDETLRKLGLVFHTDVGARLLALAAGKAIAELLPTLAGHDDPAAVLLKNIRRAQMAEMRHAVKALGLTFMDLTATWLAAVALSDGRYWVLGEGDGAVALKNGADVTVTSYDWRDGGAFYPVLRLEEGAMEAFTSRLEVTTTCNDGEPDVRKFALQEALDKGIFQQGVLQEGDDLVLFSDGIGALSTDERTAPLAVVQAARLWTDGLKRRAPTRVRDATTIVVRNLRNREKLLPLDDLSIAAISAVATLKE